MGPWGFWMCWLGYCGSSCSGPFVNSQISETLDSKQIAPRPIPSGAWNYRGVVSLLLEQLENWRDHLRLPLVMD